MSWFVPPASTRIKPARPYPLAYLLTLAVEEVETLESGQAMI
jgi:hypothetical protein